MELNSQKQTFPNNNRVREILHNAFFPLYDELDEDFIPYIREQIHSLIYHISIDRNSDYRDLLDDEVCAINYVYNLFGNKDFAKLIRKSVSKTKPRSAQSTQTTQKPEAQTNYVSGEQKLILYLKEQYDKVSSELAEAKRELEHLKPQTSHE